MTRTPSTTLGRRVRPNESADDDQGVRVRGPASRPLQGAPFETMPGVSCDQAYRLAWVVLQEHGWDAAVSSPALQNQVGIVCNAAAGDSVVTYSPESTHIPALADLMIGLHCPGNRANLVPA